MCVGVGPGALALLFGLIIRIGSGVNKVLDIK